MDAVIDPNPTQADTFTITAYAHPSGEEVGPRLTYRRTRAEDVQKGDRLMDAFGQPSITVVRKRTLKRVVRLTFAGWDDTYDERFRDANVNVFVSSEDAAPVFVPGVTPLDAL